MRRRKVGEAPSPTDVLPLTVDSNPTDHSGNRALARLGLLEDAVPLFADSRRLAGHFSTDTSFNRSRTCAAGSGQSL